MENQADTTMRDYKTEVRDLAMSFAATNGVVGDYLEFGVFRGEGIIEAVNAHDSVVSRFLNFCSEWKLRPEIEERMARFDEMLFYGFDSFKGLSAPTKEDQDWLKAGDLAFSAADVAWNMEAAGCANRVFTVEGFFSDTLKPELRGELQLDKAAIIYLDCDLYEPSKQALEWSTPLMQDNTVVVLDDYFLFGGHPKRGQRRAWEEWLAPKSDWMATELYRGGLAAFVLHKI